MKNNYSVVKNMIYSMKNTMSVEKLFIPCLIIQGIGWGAYPIIFAWLPKVIINYITKGKSIKTVAIIISIMIVLITCIMIVQKIAYHGSQWRRQNVLYNWVEKRMEKAFTMDYKNLEKPDVLNLIDRARYVTEDSGNGFSGMYNNIPTLMRNLFTIITTIGTIAVLNPILILAMSVCAFIQYKILDITKKIDKEKYTDVMNPIWRKLAYISNSTNDFEYAKDIRIFRLQDFINKKTDEVNTEAHRISKKMFNRWILSATAMNLFSMASQAVFYGWLVCSIRNGSINIGDVILFIGIAAAFNENVVQIFDVFVDLKRVSLEIDEYRSFIEYPDEIYDGSAGEIMENVDCDKFEFEFENVSFKYPGQEKYALKDINLVIKAGERLAVVGNNGAGKTTMVKLLMRLYEPTEGRILLNGVDIRKYNRDNYYRVFSPVFQEVDCFAMSLAENVSMDSKKNTDEDKVRICVEQAGLGNKVSKLKRGINTEIFKIFSDEGVDFSGGEKQKLMLARALYNNANVLVLDEPTAALDPLAENNMYKKFDEMVKGKTAVYISHRLASTRFCDNIVMFQNGQITERGTHDELLHHKGEYRRMFEVQSQYYKAEHQVSETMDSDGNSIIGGVN